MIGDGKPRDERLVHRRQLIMGAGAATLGAACGPADDFDTDEPVDTLELSLPDFSNVPVWSPSSIQSFFAHVRDLRNLEWVAHPGFMRRISWLYPDGGCESRAEGICSAARRYGLPTPYKARVIGALRFYTNNAPPGQTYVSWGFHIAPIVRTVLNLVYVLDPSIQPSSAPTMNVWLNLIRGNINGVQVGNGSAWPPLEGTWIDEQQSNWLRREWFRQIALGRDPYQVLGNDPPW
jgi:hypothetical protein